MVEITFLKIKSGLCGIQGMMQSLAVAPDASHTRTYPVLSFFFLMYLELCKE